MTRIAVLVGSLRKKSYNQALAKALEAVAPEGAEFEYLDLATLPLFNEDLEVDFPKEVQVVKDTITAADGVLFVTPEYNRSVSSVLKNAIDWASRPYGKSAFQGKPAGIVGASIVATGTAAAQAELRNIAVYLEMKVMGAPEIYMANAYEVFDEAGNLVSQRWEKNFREYIKAFEEWVTRA